MLWEPVNRGLGEETSDSIDILEVQNMDIHDVLNLISSKTGLNIVLNEEVTGKVTIYLKNVNVFDALRIILEPNDLAYEEAPEQKTIYVMTARQFEDKFGHPFAEKIKTKVAALANSKPSEILEALNQMKSPNGKILADDQTSTLILIDEPGKLESMTTFIKGWDVPLETKTFVLKFQRTETAAKAVEAVLTKNIGTVETDPVQNEIIVKDKPFKIKEIAGLMESLDQEEKEVVINAKILHVILNEEHAQGVDWEATVSNYQSLNFPKIFNKKEPQGNTLMTKDGYLSLGTLSEEDYAVLLEALDTVGEIQMISNSSLTTAARNEGQIILGSNIGITVIPSVDTDGHLNLNLKLKEDSSLKEDSQESLKKDAVVKMSEGDTLVLGGLFDDVVIESNSKIPLLGDLPLVGFAFRHEGKKLRKAETIIFLTPKIIVKSKG